jgi:hypothetical protein
MRPVFVRNKGFFRIHIVCRCCNVKKNTTFVTAFGKGIL